MVPVTASAAGPEIAGAGEPIDYAVKMRRFDEDSLLDNIAARGELDRQLVRDIASELARLHDELPPCFPDPAGQAPGTPAALWAALQENVAQVSAYPLQHEDALQLQQVEQQTSAWYERLQPTMRQRIHDGRVIDGHGDEHLGNMAVIDGRVRLFDCIEFNPDFRIIDSIGEIALLEMDLHARGHPAEAHRLLSVYLEYRGDFAGLALLDLYRCYYALVRAKVNLLRHPPDHPDLPHSDDYRELRRYLGLAHQLCQPRRRFLAITHGVSGSGKSTVAGKLVEACGAVRVRSDVERKRLFGLSPEQRSLPEEEKSLYSPEMSDKTFRRLGELAHTVLDAGFAVIVDGTFLHRRRREEFRRLAQQRDVPFVILDCRAGPDEIMRRLQAREERGRDVSEAGIEVMQRQQRHIEPLEAAESDAVLPVQSSASAAELLEVLTERLTGRSEAG